MQITALQDSIVLVVDDHPETLRMLLDALENAHMTVLVATGGKQALEQAGRLTPDLILLDAVMPGMDGFATCRSLKTGPAADVPVIFMTGLEETEHVVRGLEAGGADYLTKPIAPDELIARVRVHLANSRSAREVKAALDIGGRAMLAVGRQGNIRWATPHARRMLASLGASNDAEAVELPPAARAWNAGLTAQDASAPAPGFVIAAPHTSARLRLRLLSRVSDNESLLTIEQADPVEIERARIDKLQQGFNLTLREAEVLYWLSLGKSNRTLRTFSG
jgi:CheY-like chemotaxis protein